MKRSKRVSTSKYLSAVGFLWLCLIFYVNFTFLKSSKAVFNMIQRQDTVQCEQKPGRVPLSITSNFWNKDFNFEMRKTRNTTRHKYPMGPEVSDVLQRCKDRVYDLEALPKASIIITFHESEHLHDMLHTLHSIFQSSSEKVIAEILLIDDGGHRESHGKMLENYVNMIFAGKVRILRTKQRLGLIKARAWGVQNSVAPVIVIIDAHMEMQDRWLEALLYEIHRDRRVMVSVYNDYMKLQPGGTWLYEHGLSNSITIWEWFNFGFTIYFQDSYADRERIKKDPTLPVVCPASVGHFAMDREFFEEIGGFDIEMELWGAENIDLSIKTFLFGGKHFNVPCSHGAHLERLGQKEYRNDTFAITARNIKRVVEVWFDEYKEQFYHFNWQYFQDVDAGNLTRLFELKKRAKRTFNDYMTEDYPQMGKPIMNTVAYGGAINKEFSKHTIFYFFWRFGIWEKQGWAREEGFFLSNEGHLQHLFGSIDIHPLKRLQKDGRLTLTHSPVFNTTKVRTQWLHKKGGVMKVLGRDLCLQVLPGPTPNHGGGLNEHRLVGARCNASEPKQLWTFAQYQPLYHQLANDVKDVQTNEYLRQLSKHIRES